MQPSGPSAGAESLPASMLNGSPEELLALITNVARITRRLCPPRLADDAIAETLAIACSEARRGAIAWPTNAWLHQVVRSVLRRMRQHEPHVLHLAADEWNVLAYVERSSSACQPEAPPPTLTLRGKRQQWLAEQVLAGATIQGMAKELNWPVKEVRRLVDRLTEQLRGGAKKPPPTSTD
jgi:DNA-directed RNA polymerase specialized sigma24 family protein